MHVTLLWAIRDLHVIAGRPAFLAPLRGIAMLSSWTCPILVETRISAGGPLCYTKFEPCILSTTVKVCITLQPCSLAGGCAKQNRSKSLVLAVVQSDQCQEYFPLSRWVQSVIQEFCSKLGTANSMGNDEQFCLSKPSDCVPHSAAKGFDFPSSLLSQVWPLHRDLCNQSNLQERH
eukprot:992027-Amphidinium_carterae.1